MRIPRMIADECPLIHETRDDYFNYRKCGLSRAEAIDKIREEYDYELQDFDERPRVLIGLCLALCKQNEMIESLANETLEAMQLVSEDKEMYAFFKNFFSAVENLLKDETVYGDEAPYKIVNKYAPDWKVGDTFVHKLMHPRSEPLGISGWYIIFYKVGEYTDRFGYVHQLVCVSLCPPDKLPTCDSELQAFEFLPNCMGYLNQLTIKSKRTENSYELTKIGNFPNVLLPESIVLENPIVANPLWGYSKWDAPYRCYELTVCFHYQELQKSLKNNKK